MTLARIMQIAEEYGLNPKETEVYVTGTNIKYIGINDNVIYLSDTDRNLDEYQYILDVRMELVGEQLKKLHDGDIKELKYDTITVVYSNNKYWAYRDTRELPTFVTDSMPKMATEIRKMM